MSQMLFDQRNAGSGNAIQIDNLKNVGYLNTVQTITAGTASNFTIDLSKGGFVIVNITANVVPNIVAPINMPVPFGPGQTSAGYEWTLYFQNKSGGALTSPPTLATGAGAFRSTAVSNPTNNNAVVAYFVFDGTNHVLVGQWSASGGY